MTPPTPWRRWLAPPFTLFVYLVHPVVALTRPARQLQDPGTGWHLATGETILRTHAIPHHEIFSFTAAGQPWLQPYWLFDAGAAALERFGGLPLYAAVCILLYACIPLVLYRRMLRMDVGVLPALLMTLVAYVVLVSHGLARPHLVTYLFFALTLERLDDVRAGRRPSRALWILPPLFALWANLHGGFLAGLALVGIYAAVTLVEALVRREPAARGTAIVFAAVAVAVFVATLANPVGWDLHRGLIHHLGMRTTGSFAEFQSPAFHSASRPILVFQLLILALLVIVARSPRSLAPVEIVLTLFFLHMALQSVRHMNLFAILAAPLVARALGERLAAWRPAVDARWRAIAREQAALRSGLVYVPLVAVAVLALALAGRTGLPTSLDGLQLTRGAAEFIASEPDRFRRPFNTDNLGGALIHRFGPDRKVFVDDRIYVYGDDFVDHDYFTVLYARPGWEDVLTRWQVDSAIVNVDAACASLLRASPHWDTVFEDERVALFNRRPPA